MAKGNHGALDGEVSCTEAGLSKDKNEELKKLEDDLRDEIEKPELFFGLVGAIGTDLNSVYEMLKSALSEVQYDVSPIKLSALLNQEKDATPSSKIPDWDGIEDWAVTAHKKMDAGTALRRRYKRGDALIFPAIATLWDLRRGLNKGSSQSLMVPCSHSCEHHSAIDSDTLEPPDVVDSHAFVFDSLKHPDEVATLRKIYGRSFYLIAAYSPRESRVHYLSQKIAESRFTPHSQQFRGKAESLVERDRAESGHKLGQNVQETFPEADVFINVDDLDGARVAVSRFVQLIFGNSFHTPTREEYAMFHARAAALRSCDLGRQVGAVIATADGDIVSVGTNEVPQVGGGQYWADDNPDKRDYKVGYDSNDRMKRNMLRDIMKQLSADGWFQEEKKTEIDNFVQEVFSPSTDSNKHVNSAQLMGVIAYFRAVHAEMAAIINAARRGVRIQGDTLVCTTFPCHECSRHIVAAGIYRVIYIEPYPKSLTPHLYLDSIVIDKGEATDNHVDFQPFVGIAPRQYGKLFDASKAKRKNRDGTVRQWNPQLARPRISEYAQSYMVKEGKRVTFLQAFEQVLLDLEDKGREISNDY